MPLVNCPECGKQISDEAKRCLNCGYPMRAKQQYFGIRAVMASTVIVIGLVCLVAGQQNSGLFGFGLITMVLGVLVLLSVLWAAFLG